MGPVVNAAACSPDPRGDRTSDRPSDPGTLLTGGRRLGGSLAEGYFIAPTIFGDVDHGSDLAANEVFGPVLSVLRFRDEDEVVAKANDSDFGLGAYLHTRDIGRAHRVAGKLEAGMVIINGLPGMSPGAPVRWLQAERVRTRRRTLGDRGVPPTEERVHRRDLSCGLRRARFDPDDRHQSPNRQNGTA